MRTMLACNAAILAATVILTGAGATVARAAGVQAELRSAAALLPNPIPGAVAPTAPAAGAIVAAQPWACDTAKGFAPIVAVEQGVADPLLGIGNTGALKLPISPTTVPATCGQMALGNGATYITQAVVDTTVTPSTNRGILRTFLDPATGALIGPSPYIATTAGLDGNQPTALAMGPDGRLYVGFLKSGNVKRILNPGVGSTQVVQSVGNTPQGHPARAFAFVGNDLFIASVDSLSLISNATRPSCAGGCNATPLSDGFSGLSHTSLAFDGNHALYFSVAGNPLIPGSNQVWRLTLQAGGGLYTFVSQGGPDGMAPMPRTSPSIPPRPTSGRSTPPATSGSAMTPAVQQRPGPAGYGPCPRRLWRPSQAGIPPLELMSRQSSTSSAGLGCSRCRAL